MEPMMLGALSVYPYGLALALSAAVSLVLLAARCRNLKAGAASWFGMLALVLGVLCARLLYGLVRFDWLLEKGAAQMVRFTGGGYVLYGAVLGGMLAAWLTGKITGEKPSRLLDAATAPAALMIALSRLAETLVGQGYGRYIADWFDGESGMSLFVLENTSFFERFPFAVQDMYEEWCWAVFMLEAVFAIVLLVVMLRVHAKRDGSRAMLFLLLYAASQALCEGLREDEVLRWGFVRVNQILSAVTVAGVLLCCCLRLKEKATRQVVLAWCGTLCGMLLMIAMEFAVEKKIVWLEWLPMDMCYLITALSGVLMTVSILPIWKKQDRA